MSGDLIKISELMNKLFKSFESKIEKNIDAIHTRLDKLEKNVIEMDSISRSRCEIMFNHLDHKIDNAVNLNQQSVTNISDPNPRKINKPSFFKKLFLEQKEEYMGRLFVEEEIEVISKMEDVVNKKKDTEKQSRIAHHIYNLHIKANSPPGRLAEFESIYEQNT
jgi:hypothetical protein